MYEPALETPVSAAGHGEDLRLRNPWTHDLSALVLVADLAGHPDATGEVQEEHWSVPFEQPLGAGGLVVDLGLPPAAMDVRVDLEEPLRDVDARLVARGIEGREWDLGQPVHVSLLESVIMDEWAVEIEYADGLPSDGFLRGSIEVTLYHEADVWWTRLPAPIGPEGGLEVQVPCAWPEASWTLDVTWLAYMTYEHQAQAKEDNVQWVLSEQRHEVGPEGFVVATPPEPILQETTPGLAAPLLALAFLGLARRR